MSHLSKSEVCDMPANRGVLARGRAALAASTQRFRRDERGNVFIFTALSLPVMLMAIGAGADMAELYRAKINFQSAVDAGAIAAAKNLAATGKIPESQDIGEETFRANLDHISDTAAAKATINFNMGNGDCSTNGIGASATLPHDRFFSLNFLDTGGGSNDLTTSDKEFILTAESTVECGNDTIEIAMVLDNSGSMRWNNKLRTLKSASTSLVETLHQSMGQKAGAVRFAVVPFAGSVNVGTNNRNASWMDTRGENPIHWSIGDNEFGSIDPESLGFATKVGGVYRRNSDNQIISRFTLYDNMPRVNWGGCVEQLKYPYHTQDVSPGSAAPGSRKDTLFVPAFAPDTPDNWTNEYDYELEATSQVVCKNWESKWTGRSWWRRKRSIRYCTKWKDGYRGRTHPQDASYTPHRDDRIQYKNGKPYNQTTGAEQWTRKDRIRGEERYQNDYIDDDHNFPYADGDHAYSKDNTGGYDQYKRQKWITKYFRDDDGKSPTIKNTNPLGWGAGPNNNCTTQPISPLTESKTTTQTLLNKMKAEGSTNIQFGLAWGWRTLSPGEPFTAGRGYDVEDNKKIMIVMTDGNNTYMPIDRYYGGYSKKNKSYYHGQGHSVNGRIFEGYTNIANPSHTYQTFTKAMDKHLTTTCTNAKNAGITIYSIAFDVPNGSSVKATLEDCASADVGSSKLYFDASNNAELIDTFEKIAERLADLRVSK